MAKSMAVTNKELAQIDPNAVRVVRVRMYKSERFSRDTAESSYWFEERKNNETKTDEAKVDEAKVDEAKVDEAKVDEAKVDEAKVDEEKVDVPDAEHDDEVPDDDMNAILGPKVQLFERNLTILYRLKQIFFDGAFIVILDPDRDNEPKDEYSYSSLIKTYLRHKLGGNPVKVGQATLEFVCVVNADRESWTDVELESLESQLKGYLKTKRLLDFLSGLVALQPAPPVVGAAAAP